MFTTLLDLLTAIGLCQLAEEIKGTKYHVYLEPNAKRASVHTYINMHAWKNSHNFGFIC